jgi:DNA-binding transcriptional ArsR family regulator
MVDNYACPGIFNLMVDIPRPSPEALDQVFQALSDPTRRAMLGDLAAGPRTVGELAAPFEISLAGASKHIQVLERAGLVRREVQGRVHTCHLDARPLHAGVEWLRHYERFWNRRLDALDALLRADDAAAAAAKKKNRKKPAHQRPARSPRRKP